MKKLDELINRIDALEERQEVPMKALLNPDFMARHTKFSDIDELFKASDFVINSKEDYDRIPKEEWDAFITSSTNFSSWRNMLAVAAKELMKKQIFGK